MAQQKPISLLEFQEKFNTEEACQQHLYKMRWPNGYFIAAPNVGISNITLSWYGIILMCRIRVSGIPPANTIMHRTVLSLEYGFGWFA